MYMTDKNFYYVTVYSVQQADSLAQSLSKSKSDAERYKTVQKLVGPALNGDTPQSVFHLCQRLLVPLLH